MRAMFYPWKRERQYRWFVEPLDGGFTNQVIARRVSEENFYIDKLCGDGAKRNLWEVSRLVVRELEQNHDLRFNVFVQEGDGVLRRWPFHPKKTQQTNNARNASNRR